MLKKFVVTRSDSGEKVSETEDVDESNTAVKVDSSIDLEGGLNIKIL